MEQIALFILLGIVGAGWAALSALVIWLVQRRIRTLEARHGFDGVGMYGDVVPVAYAVALSVWPVALVVGAWQMRNPEAARQGRITLYFVLFLGTVQLISIGLYVLGQL